MVSWTNDHKESAFVYDLYLINSGTSPSNDYALANVVGGGSGRTLMLANVGTNAWFMPQAMGEAELGGALLGVGPTDLYGFTMITGTWYRSSSGNN